MRFGSLSDFSVSSPPFMWLKVCLFMQRGRPISPPPSLSLFISISASISLPLLLPLLSQSPWAGDYQRPVLPPIPQIWNERWLWLSCYKWFLHLGNKRWLFCRNFKFLVTEWCHETCCRVKVPIILSRTFWCYSMVDWIITVNCCSLFWGGEALLLCCQISKYYTHAQGIFPRLYSSSTTSFLKSFPLHCVKVWFFRCVKIKELWQ